MRFAEYSNSATYFARSIIQAAHPDYMNSLLLPFAKRLSDGKLVSPDEVMRGRACNCFCPGCNIAVLAKQGTEREWHFAHAKGEKCEEGYEVSIHELAKQMLRQRKELLLPSLIAKSSSIDAYGRILEESESVVQSQLVRLDDCKTGENLNGVHVDAIGLLKGHKILIEVTVFHRFMPDKQERLVKLRIPSIQLDLGQFKSKQATRVLMEKAIFEDENIGRWIYHPKFDLALETAQARLDGRLQENKVRREEDEAARKVKVVSISQRYVSSGWNSALSTAFKESQTQRSNLMLSASLPLPERIVSSAKTLAMQTGLTEELIILATSEYKNRAQLRGYTAESFVSKWGEVLNLAIKEVEDFLVDAGYLLRC